MPPSPRSCLKPKYIKLYLEYNVPNDRMGDELSFFYYFCDLGHGVSRRQQLVRNVCHVAFAERVPVRVRPSAWARTSTRGRHPQLQADFEAAVLLFFPEIDCLWKSAGFAASGGCP